MSKSKPKPSPKKPAAPKQIKTATTTSDKAKSPTRINGKLSILDAAARVLKEKGEPMNCKAMIERMLAVKIWKTDGKTPAATLSSALLREIKTKGKDGRFRKTDRGQFSLA
jgi:hypothetical protein